MADLLVVDDDLDVAEVLSEALRGEGHTVRVAKDGQEGFSSLSDRAPDLVLLDVEMPVLTGPEMALRMLVEDMGRERIPILLLSGSADLPRIAVQVGTPYWLAKPYSLDAVLAVLDRALKERTPPTPAGGGTSRTPK